MSQFDQERFDQLVLENGIIGFFKEPIKLKSGRLSHWYINWRTGCEDAYLLDQVTDFVLAFAKDHNLAPDTFYGVPEGATKLGVLTQFKWAKSQKNFARSSHVVAMGRGKPKEHGDPKDKYFVGVPKGNVVLLEDTTTTGGSALETITNLQAAGIKVMAMIALSNRNELTNDKKSVEAAMKDKGVPYFAMSNALTLLPKLCATSRPAPEICKSIETEFAEFGTQAITL